MSDIMDVAGLAPFSNEGAQRCKARAIGFTPVSELAQKTRLRHAQRLSVHEEALAKIQKLGARVEAHARPARPGGMEYHLRLRRGQVTSDEVDYVRARPADAREHLGGELEHARRDARRARGWGEPRVTVSGLREPALVQPVEERGAELRAARGAEADGVGVTLLERHAVVLDAGRQVQQVTGFAH